MVVFAIEGLLSISVPCKVEHLVYRKPKTWSANHLVFYRKCLGLCATGQPTCRAMKPNAFVRSVGKYSFCSVLGHLFIMSADL